VPSATPIGTSILPSWQLRFSKRSDKDGTGKCTISRNGKGVYLAIFEIDLADKIKLDRCEGLGYGYNNLMFNDSIFGECVTYVADKSSIDESLTPVDWYKEYVLLGCQFNQFPNDYVERIRNVPSSEDSDEQRSRIEWGLVEKIRDDT